MRVSDVDWDDEWRPPVSQQLAHNRCKTLAVLSSPDTNAHNRRRGPEIPVRPEVSHTIPSERHSLCQPPLCSGLSPATPQTLAVLRSPDTHAHNPR